MRNPLVLLCAVVAVLAAALAAPAPATPATGIDGPLDESLTPNPVSIHGLAVPDNAAAEVHFLDESVTLAPYPALDGATIHGLDVPADAAARAEWHVCDTTAASPRLHDIDPLIAKMRERRTWSCRNGNSRGSRCSKLIYLHAGSHELAAVSLCGSVLSVPCGRVADALQRIKDRCAWDRYAGGRFFFEQFFWVALH
ncbi:hypothetical protein EDC01DRAFT_780294 [Geopyxis carbonaria]|nr:hypothetical protein EDC01DRAFT_780294 [Geopyxis carbonaria]